MGKKLEECCSISLVLYNVKNFTQYSFLLYSGVKKSERKQNKLNTAIFSHLRFSTSQENGYTKT
jgi:hypothetical protein